MPVSSDEIDRLVRDDDDFIEKAIISSLMLMRNRREKYCENLKQIDPSGLIDDYNKRIKIASQLGLSDKKLDEFRKEEAKETGKLLDIMLEQKSVLKAKHDSLTATIKKICNDMTRRKSEVIKTRRSEIQKAINNLRTEISGQGEYVKNLRNKIENMLYSLVRCWNSFNESYTINFALMGGAGVGKTTLAKAIQKCVSAFGLISSDTFVQAEKPQLVAQYLGQTAPLTNSVLYNSLESTLFIDEAYSIVGTAKGKAAMFGIECINEIITFTQKYPGCLCIIVAGYKKDMDSAFFAINEGMPRRFPNTILMKPYPTFDIITALHSKILKKDKPFGVGRYDEDIKKCIYYVKLLVHLTYVDTTFESFDDYFRMFTWSDNNRYNFFENNCYFNLAPLIRLIYFSNDKEKRNIMKAFIFKHKLGIKEYDIFPNQLGDIQNISDYIMRQEWYRTMGTPGFKSPTLMDCIDVMNLYFSLRSNHNIVIECGDDKSALQLNPETGQIIISEPNKFRVHFCSNGVSADNCLISINDFLTEVLGDNINVFRRYVGAELQELKKKLSILYSRAVVLVSKDLIENAQKNDSVATPGYIDIDYLKAEYQTFKSLQANANLKPEEMLLQYIDPPMKVVEFNGEVEYGDKLELKQPKLIEACASLDKMTCT